MILAPLEGDTMPDGVCPYHRHCLEGLASGPAIEKRWGLSAKLMTEDHPAWELEATYLAQMCVNMIVTVSPEVIVLGGGVMQQAHLFPKIRAKVLDLLGGYVSSPSITPEGIDSYIVPPALGVNSGVIGALLLGAGERGGTLRLCLRLRQEPEVLAFPIWKKSRLSSGFFYGHCRKNNHPCFIAKRLKERSPETSGFRRGMGRPHRFSVTRPRPPGCGRAGGCPAPKLFRRSRREWRGRALRPFHIDARQAYRWC